MAKAEEEPVEVPEEDIFSTEDFKDDSFEDELYSNLIDRQDMDYNELKSLYNESQNKLKELSQENQILKQQNIILKKNISCLYLTAREEIQRKDAQLKNYQEREMRQKQFQAQKFLNSQDKLSTSDKQKNIP